MKQGNCSHKSNFIYMEFVQLIFSYVNAAGWIVACLILIDDTVILQYNGNYMISSSKNCEFHYCDIICFKMRFNRNCHARLNRKCQETFSLAGENVTKVNFSLILCEMG